MKDFCSKPQKSSIGDTIGSLTNPEKLSATFQTVKKKKISNSTIKRYIDTLVKYYFTDMGLRNARLNFRQIEETHSMENIIFNELKMRGFNVDVGVIVQYDTNDKGNSIRKQLEIDFVCKNVIKETQKMVGIDMILDLQSLSGISPTRMTR